MTPLFTKLNWKGQNDIVVLNAPDGFQPELDALAGVTVHRETDRRERVDFALAFVMTNAELQAAADAIVPKAQGDAVVAYPKARGEQGRDGVTGGG